MKSKHKLKLRDFVRFADAESLLFRELASVVCKVGVLPEKELFECWQMAELVHREFSETLHVVDMAAGHGLLGWMLVLLAFYEKNSFFRTAVCIDIKKPKSAVALAAAFKERWPELADSVHFVECQIESVRASRGMSTLFVATHACGGLSDQVILSAVAGGCSIGIMPCCHSLRNQSCTLSALGEISGIASDGIEPNPHSIDRFRIRALSALGYSVTESSISADISSYHKIILAKASPLSKLPDLKQPEKAPQRVKTKGEIQAFERVVTFDVSNLEEARRLSKRASSEWVRTFDLCFWVGSEADGQLLREEILEFTQTSVCETEVTVIDRYIRPFDEKLSMTFQIAMKSVLCPITKDDAQALRTTLCQTLELKYTLRA
ncbi:MAG: methyltransferase [Proteobacteria bacterium]|nr:MAG: methyltransferase [Pseudomonadota bacterium]